MKTQYRILSFLVAIFMMLGSMSFSSFSLAEDLEAEELEVKEIIEIVDGPEEKLEEDTIDEEEPLDEAAEEELEEVVEDEVVEELVEETILEEKEVQGKHDYGTGIVRIYKEVDHGDQNKKFNFELKSEELSSLTTFSLKHGESIELKDLEYGEYNLKEYLPDDYINDLPNNSYTFNLNEDNKKVEIKVTNTKEVKTWKGKIKIKKTIVGFHDPTPSLEGFQFELHQNGAKVAGPLTTDSNGRLEFTDLDPGEYEVIEVGNQGIYEPYYPRGSVINISEDDCDDDFSKTVKVENRKIGTPEWKGNIRIFKKVITDTVAEEVYLSGFEFELEDEDGKVTGPYSTNSAGEVDFTGLEARTYKVRELPRVGYTQVSPEGEATIIIGKDKGGDDNYWFLEFKNKKIPPKKYRNVIVKKVFEGKEIDLPQLGLLDFKFELWIDGVKYDSENSGGDFQAIFKNVPPGTYTLKEIMTDAQKEIFENHGDITIVVKPCEDKDEEVGPRLASLLKEPRPPKECEALVITFINKYKTEKPKGNLTIIKKFSDGRNPAGVEFILEGYAEITATTNTDGVAKFENLPLGSYTLNEVEIEGYESSIKGGKEIVISDRNPKELNLTIEVMNRKIPDKENKGEVEVIKIVRNENGNVIADNTTFTFRLERHLDGVWLTESTKTQVGNGSVRFSGLADGKYRLREINIPTGYTLISANNLEVEIYKENKQGVEFINRKNRRPDIPDEPNEPDRPDRPDRPRPDRPTPDRPRPDTPDVPKPDIPEEEIIIIEEEIPEGIPEVEEVDSVIVEEVEVVEEPIPQGQVEIEVASESVVVEERKVAEKQRATLPRTGAASSLMTSGIGTLLLALGLFIRRKRR